MKKYLKKLNFSLAFLFIYAILFIVNIYLIPKEVLAMDKATNLIPKKILAMDNATKEKGIKRAITQGFESEDVNFKGDIKTKAGIAGAIISLFEHFAQLDINQFIFEEFRRQALLHNAPSDSINYLNQVARERYTLIVNASSDVESFTNLNSKSPLSVK